MMTGSALLMSVLKSLEVHSQLRKRIRVSGQAREYFLGATMEV